MGEEVPDGGTPSQEEVERRRQEAAVRRAWEVTQVITNPATGPDGSGGGTLGTSKDMEPASKIRPMVGGKVPHNTSCIDMRFGHFL